MLGSATIKVVIVDDQNTIREYLDRYLAEIPEISVVGLANNGKEAIAMVKRYLPDIVLMDIEMPLMNGIEATRIISKYFDCTKILLLTSKEEKQLLSMALEAGARGYIHKTANSYDLDKIIYLTTRGYFQFGPIIDNDNYSEATIVKSSQNTSKNKIESLASVDSNTYKILSDITENISEVKKTIKIQQDRINKLSSLHKYELQEWKNCFVASNTLNFAFKVDRFAKGSSIISRNQNFLFISGFILGIVTIAILFIIFSPIS